MAGEALLTRDIAGVTATTSRTVDRRIETWSSTYSTPEAALLDPRLPKKGTTHPNNDKLILDTIDFGAVEDGSVAPVLYYSTDASFEILENPKPEVGEAPRVAMSSREFKVTIPMFTLGTVQLSNDAGGTMKTWVPVPVAGSVYDDIRPLMTYRCLVPALNFAQIRLIISQVHKIHQFDGVQGPKFEFLAPSILPQGKDKDQITYYWQYDEGTPKPPITGAEAANLAPLPAFGTGGLYSREAYHKTIGIAGIDAFDANQTPFPPRYLSIRYAFEQIGNTNYLNSWQTLPGLTP